MRMSFKASRLRRYHRRRLQYMLVLAIVAALLLLIVTTWFTSFSVPEPLWKSKESKSLPSLMYRFMVAQVEYDRTKKGSAERIDAKMHLSDLYSYKEHVDKSLKAIMQEHLIIVPPILPSVSSHYWDTKCANELLRTYQHQCGTANFYVYELPWVFLTLCEVGINNDQMAISSAKACAGKMNQEWRSREWSARLFKEPKWRGSSTKDGDGMMDDEEETLEPPACCSYPNTPSISFDSLRWAGLREGNPSPT